MVVRDRGLDIQAIKIGVCFALVAMLLAVQAYSTGVSAFQAVDGATPTSSPVSREGEFSILIRPSGGLDGDYFIIEAEPGTTHSLSVVLGNADNVPLDLTTYVSDTIPQANGGFQLETRDVAPTGVATWIDFPTERFEWQPGTGVERQFSLSVPLGTSPGQYIAGMSLETSTPQAIPGTTVHTQMVRKSIAVFIIVPGPIKPVFELGEIVLEEDEYQASLVVPIVNSGNVLVKPQGELTLRDENSQVVFQTPIVMGSVYAGTTAPLVVSLGTSFPDGGYTATLSLSDEATGFSPPLAESRITVTIEQRANAQLQLSAEVALQPDLSNPVYAEVALAITNRGEAVSSTEVIVDVLQDGELVESFPLATSLALPPGETTVVQRYIPPTGFESGTWEFVIRLNTVEAGSGAATLAATLDTLAPIIVP